MKIQKVEKLNHARFRNFTWEAALPAFSDTVNIFFGWNGSGKTTFSKFLHSIEKGNTDRGCTFKIKTDSGSLSETDVLDDLKSKTRVFNDTYVEQTLRGSSKLPYIFFAGKEAVDYSEDEKKLSDKKTELSKVVLPTSHDDMAKNTALLVKGVTGINGYKKELTGAGTYSSYDKTDFEKRVKNIKDKIAAGELASHSVLVRTDIDALKNQLVNSDRFTKNNKGIATAAKWLVDNTDVINEVLAGEPLQEHSQRIEQLETNKVAWI